MIAPLASGRYRAPMPAILWKLLAAFALLMMPFGMSTAKAWPVDDMAASMAEHCGQQPQQPDREADRCCDCAVTCSAVVPDGIGWSEPPPSHSAGRIAALHSALPDELPETATPPPRRS